MCVGISPPCSKCGAPARWKVQLSAAATASARIYTTLEWITKNLPDDCGFKDKLIALLNGEGEQR